MGDVRVAGKVGLDVPALQWQHHAGRAIVVAHTIANERW